MNRYVYSICCLISLHTLVASADDWPMWRMDAGRTGTNSADLPDALTIQWTRQLPPLEPAFHNPRLQFDAGYEPVIAQGKLLLASSLTNSVTAFDVETGKQLWQLRTNGPVRFAPAVWNDAVCFGSDDGNLYCVDLHSGDLRWQLQSTPSNRRVLGNRRMISLWPVRGGPVVSNGVVYFAAGVWPFEGVFVYAVNIQSGEVIWRNDRLGYLFGQQPHNTQAIGGLAPQGYCVLHADELIVPCSTAYPARLNRKTGELIEFELPGAGRFPGGWFAAMDPAQAKAIRRGELTFDDVINRQRHENRLYKGEGTPGVSRKIRAGAQTLNFDDGFEGVEGTIHAMAVANNRLFVTTREGMIYCFAKTTTKQPAKPEHWQQELEPLSVSAAASQRAKALVSLAATKHGYAVVIGLQETQIVKALTEESNYHVIAIDDDHARANRLRGELECAGLYADRATVLDIDFAELQLPPYFAQVLTTESPNQLVESERWQRLLLSLRPFGGVADFSLPAGTISTETLEPLGTFQLSQHGEREIVSREGPLPGTTNYLGGWAPSADALVRFPLGVLWFDDSLAHFKRSPQPKFVDGVMISQRKDWNVPTIRGEYSIDYPLLPHTLSDMYTGRLFDASEHTDLRTTLPKPAKKLIREPSQYRPPHQKDAWKPEQPVAGVRTNPLTGETEPRAFPKSYGCDGGVDYGAFYTLRSGTPAFYDKTMESGTVFLSGPRSGCTNSIIPAGGLLNVPYFYEGCTCSYPLPTAMSLVAMPESHEQWSSWGRSEFKANSIQRIGLNFGAPGDRVTRAGTLWLDYPSVGGPSPKISVTQSPETVDSRYRHSLWMNHHEGQPWVTASSVEGLEQLVVNDLRPGTYAVRLYFAEPDEIEVGQRVQDVSLQGREVLSDLDLRAAAGVMRAIVREFDDIEIDGTLTLKLASKSGKTLISGIELIRQDTP